MKGKAQLEKPVYKGFNLAYPDRKTSFIAGGISGETVIYQSYLEKKNYRLCQVKKVISPSHRRVKPRCKVYSQCGGCQYQHIEYKEQLNIKLQIAQEILAPYPIKEIIPSPRPFRYRNKALLPVKNGKIGFYALHSHQIIPFPDCFLQTKRANKIIQLLKKEKKLLSQVQGIIIRVNQIDQLLLAFITSSPGENLVKICKKFFFQNKNLISSLWLSYKTTPGNYLLDGKNQFICGEKDFYEIFNEQKIYIQPNSFLQINTHITEKIYGQIKKWIENNSYRIIDGYAGCGSIALSVAEKEQELLLAENNPASFQMLQKNLQANNFHNFQTFEEDFENALEKINLSPKDILILDPPRKGISQTVINKIKSILPNQLIYLSCNPTTLKRDLDLLSEYQPAQIIIYDMFPQTYHFETLTLLEKK